MMEVKTSSTKMHLTLGAPSSRFRYFGRRVALLNFLIMMDIPTKKKLKCND